MTCPRHGAACFSQAWEQAGTERCGCIHRSGTSAGDSRRDRLRKRLFVPDGWAEVWEEHSASLQSSVSPVLSTLRPLLLAWGAEVLGSGGAGPCCFSPGGAGLQGLRGLPETLVPSLPSTHPQPAVRSVVHFPGRGRVVKIQPGFFSFQRWQPHFSSLVLKAEPAASSAVGDSCFLSFCVPTASPDTQPGRERSQPGA